MQHGITKLFIGSNNFLEISDREFDEAKVAKQNLLEVLSIEEKFNLILENYAEYENELLTLSLKHMIFSGRDWSSFENEIHIISRRLINLLTICRLYIDQIPHNLNSIYGAGSGKIEMLKGRMSQEYDSNLGYRVLEALRNYVQHRGLPIYRLEYNASRQENTSGIYFKHIITPYLSVSRLKEEKRFKSVVLNELETIRDLIDLKPLVRQYMESLGRVHQFIRELLTNDVTKWDSAILQIQKLYCDQFAEDALGLAVVVQENDSNRAETIQIFDDMIKHRQWLIRKNRMLTHYNSGIISSEARPRDI